MIMLFCSRLEKKNLMREEEFFFKEINQSLEKLMRAMKKTVLEFFFGNCNHRLRAGQRKHVFFLIRRAYLKQRKQHGGLKSNKKF